MSETINTKKATVIIPNFNGMKYLPDCIASLNSQTTDDIEVVVVDNGSSDGSLEWLKANAVKHIALQKNLGFAGGVNMGLKACRSPYAILLNNDTVVEPSFAEELIKAIERSKKIFAVSSKMVKASDHTLMDDAGDGLNILGWAYQRGVDEPVEDYDEARYIFSACAGAAIYRMSILDEIGLFDENHFAYLEDIDLCYRAKLAGYRNYFCPKAVVYHIGSATSGSKYNPFKVKLAARNNIYLHYKNQGSIQLVINLLPLFIGTVLKFLFFVKKGFAKEYLAGIAEGFATLDKCTKAPRAKYGLLTYLQIEGEMICNMFEYTFSYLKRKSKA